MNRLGWELQGLVRAVGLPGWLAGALCLAAAAAWAGVLRPMATRLEVLQADSSKLERQLARRQKPAPSALSPQQQLQAFERRFTDVRGIAPAMARIHAAAQRHGLRLEQAEFKLIAQEGDAIARYTMDWPVKADYRVLRRFVSEVLHEQAAIALESISLQRTEPAAAMVDARLKLVLFVSRAG